MPSSRDSQPYPLYEGAESSSTYEEHDLGSIYSPSMSRAGHSSPMAPARSPLSSPLTTRYSGSRARHSLDPYACGYNRSAAPSSAPSRYMTYDQPEYDRNEYFPRQWPGAPSSAPSRYRTYDQPGHGVNETIPGQWPGAADQESDNNISWYAGPAMSSSRLPHGWGSQDFRMSSRNQSPLPPYIYSQEAVPELFDVAAPHHAPGSSNKGARYSKGPDAYPTPSGWGPPWYGPAYSMVRPSMDLEGLSSRDGLQYPYGYDPSRSGCSSRGGHNLTKEERVRMLEKQFGKPKIKHRGDGDKSADDADIETTHKVKEEEDDVDADVPIGGVTSRGKLVTERPKTDLTLRCLIVLTALAIVGCGIGGALLIKVGDKAPAAKGSLPSYVLYIASALSLLVILYSYVLRACCCNPMRKECKQGGFGGPGNGMVIPVLSGGPMGKKMKMKRGRRGRMGMMPPPTVNLIVDPAMFGGNEREGKRKKTRRDDGSGSEDSDASDDPALPGDARRSPRRRNGIGVMDNMQMQRRWHMARHSLKIRTALDALLFVVWIATSAITIGLGKKDSCPLKEGNGWCNYYNAAIACGVIQAVWLALVLYLDFRDLSVSRLPPRPPM